MRCITLVVVLLSINFITFTEAGAVKNKGSKNEYTADELTTADESKLKEGQNSEKDKNEESLTGSKDSPTPIVDKTDSSKQTEKLEDEDLKKLKTGEEVKENGKVNYQGKQLIRIAIKNKEDGKFIKSLETDGGAETWLNNGTAIDVVVKSGDIFRQLKEKNIKYDVIIDDLQKAIDEENPSLSEEEWTLLEGRKVTAFNIWDYNGVGFTANNFRTRLGFKKYSPIYSYGLQSSMKKQRLKKKRYRLTWQMYHRMTDIHGYLDYLAATYPQNVSIEEIGKSVEGRPLRVLKLSSGQPNRPAIWVDAGIHAREWITPASLTYIISQMIEGGDGARNVDWYFQPLVNPDGYEHSHSKDRLWRKNRAHPEKGSCAGIDLNRNFGYKWGGQGASRQPCRETFAGSGPFSEPETAAIQKFILSKQGQVKGYVSLHSYGQYILYPWGYDRKVPVDYQDLERVGRQMATAIRNGGGPSYTVGAAANTLYPASGGSDDWAKGTAKIKYAYTLELRDNGRHGFILPAQYIVPAAKDAYAALDVLAQEVSK